MGYRNHNRNLPLLGRPKCILEVCQSGTRPVNMLLKICRRTSNGEEEHPFEDWQRKEALPYHLDALSDITMCLIVSTTIIGTIKSPNKYGYADQRDHTL